MSLQGYLLGLKMSTLFAFCAWAGVVLYIDPEASGMFGQSLFFATLFLWLAGILTLLMTWLQRKLFDDEWAAHALGANMRRSVFIASFSLILLLLLSFRMLVFWNGLLVGAAFLLIELYFVHSAGVDTDMRHAQSKHAPPYSRLKHRAH